MRVHYLLPLAAAVGVALFAIAPVWAKPPHPPYPPPHPGLTVSPATLVGCGTVVVKGTGYDADELVKITVSTKPPVPPEQIVRTDAHGAFSATVSLSTVGLATITAIGKESSFSASAVVKVMPPACQMPVTGNNSSRLLWIGGTAVGSGALVSLLGTLLWRRRHDHRADV